MRDAETKEGIQFYNDTHNESSYPSRDEGALVEEPSAETMSSTQVLAKIDEEYAVHPSQALLNERLKVLCQMMREMKERRRRY